MAAVATSNERSPLRMRIRETNGAESVVSLAAGQPRYVIGRRDALRLARVDLSINDRMVSRKHCAVTWDEEENTWMLEDLNSSNGTMVDGHPLLAEPARLDEGAHILIGTTMLTVLDGEPEADDIKIGNGAAEPRDGLAAMAAAAAAREAAAGGAEEHTVLAPPAPAAGAEAGADGTVMMVVPTGASDDGTELLTAGTQTLDRDVTAFSALPMPEPAGDGSLAPTTTAASGTAGTGAGFGGTTAVDSEASTELATPLPGGATTAATEPETTPPPQPAAQKAARPQTTRAATEPPIPPEVPPGILRTLIDAHLVDPARAVTLARTAQEKGITVFRAVADDNALTKVHPQIYQKVAELFGLELIEQEKALMDRALEESWLNFSLALKQGAVILASQSGGPDEFCTYATIDPFDLALKDRMASRSGKPTKPLLVVPTIFQSALQRLKYRVEDEAEAGNMLVIEINQETEAAIQSNIENADVPLFVNLFFQRAFLQGASDIHVEPTEEFMLVRNRIDGMLHEEYTLPKELHPEIVSRIKILSGMDVAEKRRPQDGRIGTVIRDNAIDVRVSSYPTIYGEKIVMRLLDKNALRPNPEHLGMLPRDLRLLYDKLDSPFGLIMISGPTGSGKTTTLYSCLGSIDKKAKNVLTVEDPVEYRLKGVHQMQVNERIGLTFASGLRTILRQDPDVIMVGECRDQETAAMAIQASLTGHIVFSTIHTNDAVGVVTRLIDMGIDPFLVANSVTLAIAQRLVRKVCKHCAQPMSGEDVNMRLLNEGISQERMDSLGIKVDEDLDYVVGHGCAHCRNTGYSGRQAVFEVFEMTNAARAMISSGAHDGDTLRQRAKAAGMTTLISHGLSLVEEGITTHAEVIRVLGESY